MVALGCIAAARTGFLLAALHSVAKRFSRRPVYHPTQPVPVHQSRWAESRQARWCAKRQDARFLRSLPPLGTCLACYRTGTKLQVVIAGAGIAVSGSAHGERRVSGVRRAAPLWWFFPDERVSPNSIERCQLQRASRATSERGRFRASAQESSKRARPARSRRLQSPPPQPLPHNSVPVC